MDKREHIAKLEQLLRRHNGAEFVELVLNESVVQPQLFMSFSAFGDEPELLHAALQFASYNGRSVTVIPSIEHHPELKNQSFHA